MTRRRPAPECAVAVCADGLLPEWAAWAVKHRTGVGVIWAATPTGDPAGEAARVLHDAWHHVTREDLAWLGVLTGAPHIADYTELGALLGGMREGRDFVRWRDLGEVGACAYATGVSIDEAEARWAVGTLKVEDLVVLAALRGWRLPNFESSRLRKHS